MFRCVSTAAIAQPEADPEPEPEPEPEPKNVAARGDRIEILQKVQFEVGSAEILSVSFSLLDEVAQTLNDRPEITSVRVEGHTDSTGSASTNRRLSQERAESVRDYLIAKGVADARLEAKGFGPDQPLDSNDSEEGRYQNRRVEFKILGRE